MVNSAGGGIDGGGGNRLPTPYSSVHIFSKNPMGWKSDPLDRAGGPSPKATPQKPRRDFLFGVALRYRYKRDLHKGPQG